MKDWCMKHPLLTFIILDELIVTIGNVLSKGKKLTKTEYVMREAAYAIEDVKELRNKSTEKEKEPIGFKAS